MPTVKVHGEDCRSGTTVMKLNLYVHFHGLNLFAHPETNLVSAVMYLGRLEVFPNMAILDPTAATCYWAQTSVTRSLFVILFLTRTFLDILLMLGYVETYTLHLVRSFHGTDLLESTASFGPRLVAG
jgi:hypothetical protein